MCVRARHFCILSIICSLPLALQLNAWRDLFPKSSCVSSLTLNSTHSVDELIMMLQNGTNCYYIGNVAGDSQSTTAAVSTCAGIR